MRRVIVCLSLVGCSSGYEIARLNSPPDVAIVAPAPLAELRKGAGPVAFVGTVEDSYDALADMTIRWSLDDQETFDAEILPDGRIRLTLDVEPLALGAHEVALSAIDQDGEEGMARLPWTLDGAISAPDVTITAPEDGALYAPGEEITFRGEAIDNLTPGDGLVFQWASSLDGPLAGAVSGGGSSVLFTSDLSVGLHVVTLTVTDADGEVGEDRVSIDVAEVVEQPAAPGDLVFSELMINPEIVDDAVGEWVELFNTAGYAIDVGGYSFHDLDLDFEVLEGPLLVAPGGYVVLCADTNPAVNGGIACDGAFKRQTSGALALGNNGDEVILSTPAGVVVDQVIYDPTWYSAGVAIGLDPALLDADNNDTPANWCDQSTTLTVGGEPGTPGRANDPC
jgi:hypothetical protein